MTGALWRYLRSFTGFSRDARLFLLTTIVFGAALSLYWIDFNLYLESIGLGWAIGWLMAASQLAGVIVALPASAISDRIGRRKVMAAGIALVAVALFAFLPGDLPLLFLGVVALGAGSMAVSVVQVPFIAEHTRPDQRNEYFAIWSAIGFLTGVVAALVGGAAAPEIASLLNLGSDAAPYQILLSGVAVLGALSLGTVWLLTGDGPPADRALATGARRFGIVVLDRKLFFRLLLPGFLTSLGAGQLIPFLNVFIQNKFGLGLAAVNAVFAVSSLGTALAILVQPAVARRFGRIGSIVLVQGASLPFLVVLGFSPVLWTVIVALAVRNSLMNAGSPIFDAFAMERISPTERATLSAGMTMLWSLGWTIAPLYYGVLHASLSFTAAFAVDFVTIIVLYTVATCLLWTWFRGTDRVAATAADEEATLAAAVVASESPSLIERA
ncbi:MAG: MFS transporter [Candidatus Limnocylindrales bacterium]